MTRFAAPQHMRQLAERLGVDHLEVRNEHPGARRLATQKDGLA